jgi:hypothetical protein
MSEISEADMQSLARQIPWNDEPMPDHDLVDLYRAAIIDDGLELRAVQEIARLRHQVGSLRQDRRENYTEVAQLRAEVERLRTATRQVAALADEWDRFGLTGPAQRIRDILGEEAKP